MNGKSSGRGPTRRGFLGMLASAVLVPGCVIGAYERSLEIDPNYTPARSEVPEMPKAEEGRWPSGPKSRESEEFDGIYKDFTNRWHEFGQFMDIVSQRMPCSMEAENRENDQSVTTFSFFDENIRCSVAFGLSSYKGSVLYLISHAITPDGRYITAETVDEIGAKKNGITTLGSPDGSPDWVRLRWGNKGEKCNDETILIRPEADRYRGPLSKGSMGEGLRFYQWAFGNGWNAARNYLDEHPEAAARCPDLHKALADLR